MENFSLLHPTNSNASYRTLNKEALNDLSVDYICDALTKEQYERNSIKQLLINITDDEEVIKYRCDVFEDFLRFPKLRDDLSALLVKLNDLREIERFQKDTEASSLWQLVNRLREMDGYVDCITRIKNTLETIEVKSQGLLELKKNVQSIYNDSGFPELKKDIIDTLAKAQKLKSITLGVNLDDLLRPKSVGVISLNDKEFTDSGILKRFMKFTNRDSELHHGNDVSGFLSFHPSNPSTSQFGLGQFIVGAQQDVNHTMNSSLTGALVEYVNEILKPVNAYKGNKLPVSTFMDHVDGTAPNGSAAYEKRGIAVDVPEWNPENCIQCNRCAIVCPHAVIRPVAMTADELAKAPEGTKSLPMMGLKDLNFVMTVSTLDCTGCGACAQVCPGKKGAKALTMQSIDSQRPKQAVFDYALTLEDKPEVHEKFKFTTVKGSQFKQPLLEFSGACAGCGETPYAKLVTQLFGDRMFIANATGCSSIWGASAPATPYTKNKKGYGPAWQNSLFEDNAEFGLGMALGQKAIRNRLIEYVEGIQKDTDSADLKTACQNYLDTVTDSTSSRPATYALIAEL